MIRKILQAFVVSVVLFGLYGSASAVDNHWLGTAGDNEWGNAANWELGHVPDAVLWPKEEAEIGYTTVGAGPILGVGDVGSAYRVFLGQSDGDTMYGELTMDGGTLTTSGYMSTAYHEGTSALITMNSGSVYIGDPAGSNGHLYLGRAGSAILNINGGTFIADDSIQLGRNATGYGEINLAGGTLQASTLKLGAGTGLIDITGGTLILNGDATAVVDAFITSGLIVGYAGTGTVDVVLENDLTTVTAVPGDIPVEPTSYVIEQRIADDLDDAEEDLNPSKLGEIDDTSSDLEMPYEDPGMVDPQFVGLRYANLAIPAGSYIANAWVRFQVDETKDGSLPVNLIIQGELNPNAPVFVGGGPGTFDISTRARTATSVQWSVPNWTAVGDQGPDQTTVDISSVIQEIVDQPGWASGNALVLIFSDDPTNPSTGIRCAEAGPGDDSALLHIEYSTAAPTSFALTSDHITATASSAYTAEEGPEKTIDGSGLDADDLHSFYPTDMWISDIVAAGQSAWIQYEFDRAYALDRMLVWNHNTMVEHLVGFGIRQATIEYSLDGGAWVSLGDAYEFGRAPGEAGYASDTTIDLGGVVARYLRITPISNWGGVLNQYGLSEVRFMYIPMRASKPEPASGTKNAEPQLTLNWNPGGQAALHDVYLSTNEQSVIDGTAPVTTVAEAAYGPLSLGLGQTYFWRVDEVNEAEDPAVWEGDIWSFSTSKHYVVDNFESYTDYEGNRIYEIWLDGFTNNTGSVVGHAEAPFAEQTIIHSGKQSMPLAYNNADSPFYSEAERTWAEPQDWTASGADTLNLYVRGDTNNGAAPLYVAVQESGGIVNVVIHPDGEAAVLSDSWQQWSIPLSAFSDTGVDLTQVKTMYVGVGDRDNPTAGGAGIIYIDDITLGRTASAEGYALVFDGIDDYVETPISDVPVDGTVEAWVKTTISDTRQAVFSSYGDSQEFRLHLNYRPGKGGATPGFLGLNVRFRTLTAYTDIGSEMYDGSWHHVAFVWEGASPGTIRAYWDGQEKPVTYRDQNTWEGNYNRGAVHVIGREDLSNNNYFFSGMIDEVRFWHNKARTEAEIQEYMDLELSGDEEGLMGYWKFNEAEGTTAYDSSPNGNNGTIVGASWTADAAPVASAPVVGYALEFDGIDDYVETPISDVPMDGTVEAWVKTVSEARQAVISSHGGEEFRLHLNYRPGKGGSSPGVLGLNVLFGTFTAYTDIGSQMYDGSWHHVAFVWEGASPGTIRAYWDGQEKTVTYRNQSAWAGNYNRNFLHVIGREDLNNNNYFFAGMIDEVRFWHNKARTGTEIQEYMNQELSGDEEGLMGYWKFNEAEGTTAYDSSPNNNNGTIAGASWTTDAAPVAP
ncbi:MAG: LamG-like jellyroll fold domain-containing protein [Planctomycetota bacterium]|jgi:hypothetical protein